MTALSAADPSPRGDHALISKKGGKFYVTGQSGQQTFPRGFYPSEALALDAIAQWPGYFGGLRVYRR